MIRNSKCKRQEVNHVQPKTRAELEAEYGQLWDTRELARDFIVTAIIHPLIVVTRKADGVVGTLAVKERPKLYFGFQPDEGKSVFNL